MEPRTQEMRGDVRVVLHEREKQLVREAAARCGRTISAWSRELLVAEAARVMSTPSTN